MIACLSLSRGMDGMPYMAALARRAFGAVPPPMGEPGPDGEITAKNRRFVSMAAMSWRLCAAQAKDRAQRTG